MIKYWLSFLVAFLLGSCSVKSNSPADGKMSNTETQMEELIKTLIQDSKQHNEIGIKLTDAEILEAEKALGKPLPESYKLFLKRFGNGANWLYTVDQPINGVNMEYGKIHWLGKYRDYLEDETKSDGFGTFKTNTLLCLMSENSNGGAWVWLTSETSKSGEWPIAYHDMNDKKLYFKVDNFTEWIRLMTECKGEVIRVLNKGDKLILG
ncbi:MAG: SMI1/KNR4 family protein [Saprospiraceae bacterium]